MGNKTNKKRLTERKIDNNSEKQNEQSETLTAGRRNHGGIGSIAIRQSICVDGKNWGKKKKRKEA